MIETLQLLVVLLVVIAAVAVLAARLQIPAAILQVIAGVILALVAKLADGKLTVVESLEAKEPKTKLYRAALDKLEVRRTALIVESGAALGQNLLKGARNLVGVDLMLNNEVHPYDLLKAERVIFSRSALEKLQESLKKSAATRRKAEVA